MPLCNPLLSHLACVRRTLIPLSFARLPTPPPSLSPSPFLPSPCRRTPPLSDCDRLSWFTLACVFTLPYIACLQLAALCPHPKLALAVVVMRGGERGRAGTGAGSRAPTPSHLALPTSSSTPRATWVSWSTLARSQVRCASPTATRRARSTSSLARAPPPRLAPSRRRAVRRPALMPCLSCRVVQEEEGVQVRGGAGESSLWLNSSLRRRGSDPAWGAALAPGCSTS